MRMIASKPLEYRFVGTESIQITRDMQTEQERFELVNEVLEIVKNDWIDT